ncbi:hypothetical protein QBC44DRAFT_264767 [Cladorrhinum sp. PSN332]|nr:hypothetical protein QBC44DRAFT_264767 [Cladorrhinum sp. PSN332]
MKSLLILPLLLLPTWAVDPTKCNTSNKQLTASDFVLVAQPDSPNVSSLSAIFAAQGRKLTISQLLGDVNHKLTTNSAGRKVWEDGDENTKKWLPQGISSTADALDVGTYQGKNAWVVSWHRDDNKSVRVTFVDRGNGDQYRHALLVYPHAADDFSEVPVHAGGILWYGDILFVVDTRNGIRAFDLTNVWRVGTTGDGVGKTGNGTYTAAGYKYVIPQIRWFKWTPSFPFRFSFISLDRTTSPDSLVVGEYQPNTTVPIRFVRWPLDYTTRKLKAGSDGKTTQATWAYCVNIVRMQGAVSADGKFYISRSNGANGAGDLYGWKPGNAAYENNAFYPRGPEDLSYDKRNGGRIYMASEYPGARYIIDTPVSSVRFS